MGVRQYFSRLVAWWIDQEHDPLDAIMRDQDEGVSRGTGGATAAGAGDQGAERSRSRVSKS